MAKLTISDKVYQKSMEKIDAINTAKIDLSFDARDIDAQIFLDEFKQEEKRILNTKVADLTINDQDNVDKLRKKWAKFKKTPQWNKFNMSDLFKKLDDIMKKWKKHLVNEYSEKENKKRTTIKYIKIFSLLATVILSALALIIGGLRDTLNSTQFSALGILAYLPILLVFALSIYTFVMYYIKISAIFTEHVKYLYALANIICTAYLTCACVVLKGGAFTASNYHLAFTPYAILFWANVVSFSLSIIMLYHCITDLASILPKFFQAILSSIRLLLPIGLWIVFIGIVSTGPSLFYLPFYLCLILTLVFTLATYLSTIICRDEVFTTTCVATISVFLCIFTIVCGILHRTDIKQIDNTTIIGAYSVFNNRIDVYSVRVDEDTTTVVISEDFGDNLRLSANAVADLKGKVTQIILTENVTIVEPNTFDNFDGVEICVWFSNGSLPENWASDWTNSDNIHYNYSF